MAVKAKGSRIFALLASTVFSTMAMSGIVHRPAFAQTASQKYEFNIAAKPVRQSINDIVRVTGMDVVFQETPAATSTGNPVHGALTSQQALAQLLAGSSLSYQFTGANTVTIIDRAGRAHKGPTLADGSLLLNTITVSGGLGIYAPYETPTSDAYIAGEQIERLRGSSPADIFRGTPGVMSGQARSGGALDVNIRGMQGLGRVDVKVDDVANATTIYQGYQGVSNRTFMDPDLIAGADISKGPTPGSFGVGGTVAMRTLSADDIVSPGKTFGARLKGGFGGNTSKPEKGDQGGYIYPPRNSPGPVIGSETGMDRPAFLEPTNGHGSAVVAMKTEQLDLLAGYAYRKRGNYHAGTHGPHANPVHLGPQRICTPSVTNPANQTCVDWPDYVENTGISAYRPGEEVLNTHLETRSWLAKADWRIDDAHSLHLNYNRYDSEQGEQLASLFNGVNNKTRPIQAGRGSLTELDSGSVKYRFNPQDSEAVDLTATLWGSQLKLRYPRRSSHSVRPIPGLPADFRTGIDALTTGFDVVNKSKFETAWGDLQLDFGGSLRREETKPSAYTVHYEGQWAPRNGVREEAAAFVNGRLTFNDQWAAHAGLRYQAFRAWDRTDNPDEIRQTDPSGMNGAGFRQTADGFSPSFGVIFTPTDNLQLYSSYSIGQRMPSLTEATTGFFTKINPDLRPEQSRNFEIGANIRGDGLLADGDRGMLKIGYFRNDIKDYLARLPTELIGAGNYPYIGTQMHNIDSVIFSGLELSGRYEVGGFSAELGATYYTDIRFCETAGNCRAESLYADYTTNHIPPEYNISLTLTQKFMEERLQVGGRVSWIGPRAIGHGDLVARGAQPFISQIGWKPYATVDLFGSYKFNDTLTLDVEVENLTDTFYIEALSLSPYPAPGRSFRATLTAKF